MLLHTATSAGAFVSPAAVSWLRGGAPREEHRQDFARCRERWQQAGLTHRDSRGPARAVARIAVTRPVLVVAMSRSCGFCAQLTSDLAANTPVLGDATIALVDGDRVLVHGVDLEPGLRAGLAGLTPAEWGTPSGVLFTPTQAPRTVQGYDEVTHAVIEITGADPRTTVVETPTTCSVNVTAAPADALVAARAGDQVVGIAVRGEQALSAVTEAVGDRRSRQYAPITLTVERPRSLFLLYRGGSLVARARTAEDLCQSLVRVLDGYVPPEAGQVAVLCGAAVHRDQHAVLFPAAWMSEWTTRARVLGRSGWHIRPEPYSVLHAEGSGTPVLTLPSGGVRLTGALTDRLPGPPSTSRLRARVVNWIARPTTPAAVHTLATMTRELPVRHTNWRDGLTQLTTGGAVSRSP